MAPFARIPLPFVALALEGCAPATTAVVPDLAVSLVASRPEHDSSRRTELEVLATLRTSGASARRARPDAPAVTAYTPVVVVRATRASECTHDWTCAYERLAILRVLASLERSEP